MASRIREDGPEIDAEDSDTTRRLQQGSKRTLHRAPILRRYCGQPARIGNPRYTFAQKQTDNLVSTASTAVICGTSAATAPGGLFGRGLIAARDCFPPIEVSGFRGYFSALSAASACI